MLSCSRIFYFEAKTTEIECFERQICTHNLIVVVHQFLCCCILCEIFTQTLENFDAMKTGGGSEFFGLTAVSKACWTGTE